MECGLRSFASGSSRSGHFGVRSTVTVPMRSDLSRPTCAISAPRDVLAAHQLLVRHAMRRIGISTFPSAEIRVVLLEVPLEPDDFRVPLEREDVRRVPAEEPPIVRADYCASRELQ